MKAVMPSFVDAMYSTNSDRPGWGLFRVMLRTSQQQNESEKQWLLNRIHLLSEKHFPSEPGSAGPQTTGFFVLLSQLVSSVLRDQNVAVVVASIAIFAMMLVAFRNWRVALIAMIPNLLPIFAVLGTLGWLGIRINMGSAMIAAVSIGLSIDSSIHYLWTFRRARLAGQDTRHAIQAAQQRAGRAMVFSTFALVTGFASLYVSQFIPTVYFGVLASLTMIGGLLGNLFLLPLLLTVFARDVYRVSGGTRA